MDKIIRSSKHLNYVRSLPCLISQQGQSQACHIRILTDGGTSIKPSDFYVLPFIYKYHRMQTEMGELSFYKFFNINPFKSALELTKSSPCSKVRKHKLLLEERMWTFGRLHKDI